MADLDNYMPPQWSAQENVDLRGAIMGVASKRAENVGDKKNNSVLHVGRYKTMGKRKRGGEDEGEEEMDEDEMEERREKAMKVIVDPTIYGNGKGSGRKWKAPAQKASSLKKSVPTKAWEKKMRDRDLHKRMQAIVSNAIEEKKAHRREEKERREAAKALKEANRLKSNVVREVTAKTVKKMSKKQLKKITTADTTKVHKK